MKKLFTLFLVLATTFALVGCGSSGGSSDGSTTYITDEVILNALANKTMDFEFKADLSPKAVGPSLRGNTIPSYKAVIHGLKSNLTRDDATKYSLDNLSKDENNFINIRIALTPKDEVLKKLILSELYEVEILRNDSCILKSILKIDRDTKYNNILNNRDVVKEIDDATTAEAIYIEKLAKDAKITSYDNFKDTYKDDSLNAIVNLINQALENPESNIFNENGELSQQLTAAIENIITENHHNQNQGGNEGNNEQLYNITGNISGGGLIGTEGPYNGNILYYVVATKKNAANVWEMIWGNDTTAPISVSSTVYHLFVPAGTYQLRVIHYDDAAKQNNATPILTTPEITVPKPGSTEDDPIGEGYTHNIEIP